MLKPIFEWYGKTLVASVASILKKVRIDRVIAQYMYKLVGIWKLQAKLKI